MIFVMDHKTRDMFDRLARFAPHRSGLLEGSWAKSFPQDILYELLVDKVVCRDSVAKGTPTKGLYAMLCITLLQQLRDLRDEQTLEQVAFNQMCH